MKKKYLKPQIKELYILVGKHLLSGSELRNYSQGGVGTYLGREADCSDWDDDEDDEEVKVTRGWSAM